MDLSRAKWRKSTRSGSSGNCVEVADNLPGIVAVRDSKDPNGPALTFTRSGWEAFIGRAKNGEFDD
ncbi:DUF397 domain-containing protein [Actinoplanes xinjiangensis]|uniref:Uncharacterized protein DUF397 n=1 Tax=Actinoplanes xinjiangensis TaxID=512350 RepID=A0A316FGY3_9ACTN|nr:DUF397 domain-containing protein [Actinoplanes xinjiangensis]PWK48211.1 uncharacterized protein DUF397 [Actinoplanes xinjiangensis]GIF39036.1 transcriptional regulator [Actinoplanes xinjiangensis]